MYTGINFTFLRQQTFCKLPQTDKKVQCPTLLVDDAPVVKGHWLHTVLPCWHARCSLQYRTKTSRRQILRLQTQLRFQT